MVDATVNPTRASAVTLRRVPELLDGHIARILGVVDQSDFLMRHLIGDHDPMDIIHLEFAYSEGHLGLDEHGITAKQLWDGEPSLLHRYRGDFWAKFWVMKIEKGHPVVYYEAGQSNQSVEIGTIWLSTYHLWSSMLSEAESGVRTFNAWDLFPDVFSEST